MALSGLGAQSEFQAVAFHALLGIEELVVYDVDPAATDKFRRNLDARDIRVRVAASAPEATEGADIITTATADQRHATIVSANMVGAGVHLHAIGGDCHGTTEVQPAPLDRASVFVDHLPPTRLQGEHQHKPA